jgi:hypothetical protein
MAEPTQIIFSYKEVAEALLKTQDIHEGIWGIFIKFGISAGNVGPTADQLAPAAIVPVLQIGLQKFDAENNLSVDAAHVHPKPLIPNNRTFRKPS